MPYKVTKRTGKRPWKVVKISTGEVVGSSESKSKAQDMIQAIYASKMRRI